MAIFGIGTDIAEIVRFETVSARFAERVLAKEELVEYQNKKQPHRYLAKRFAAKEAASKALGTGIAQGISFHDFIVANKSSGQPYLIVQGKAKTIMDDAGIVHCHLSISDEKHYAVATVLLETD
ncbi:holo-ACP synthase [Catenovulum sp. SM1970]|uniref:holo-ACP synthase n=1 Tax=Marinifaba aquimaris TaxID=2741323 RepID=UPI0015717BAF|nr:holo-ACP synthase [Marinifaba aquimaris]NTS76418.1 holo-ACP synthase [Marinifaba aquimaris]